MQIPECISVPINMLPIGVTPTIVYSMLDSLADEDGLLRISARKLADIVKLSDKHVRTIIRNLEEAGFISVDRYYTGYRIQVHEPTDDKIAYYWTHILKRDGAPKSTAKLMHGRGGKHHDT